MLLLLFFVCLSNCVQYPDDVYFSVFILLFLLLFLPNWRSLLLLLFYVFSRAMILLFLLLFFPLVFHLFFLFLLFRCVTNWLRPSPRLNCLSFAPHTILVCLGHFLGQTIVVHKNVPLRGSPCPPHALLECMPCSYVSYDVIFMVHMSFRSIRVPLLPESAWHAITSTHQKISSDHQCPTHTYFPPPVSPRTLFPCPPMSWHSNATIRAPYEVILDHRYPPYTPVL